MINFIINYSGLSTYTNNYLTNLLNSMPMKNRTFHFNDPMLRILKTIIHELTLETT